ncbi:MAG: hypothetical protein K8T89_06210 [Planctomycetes bacterium]|nr:hypothetical protein [Planctomycetota bacterium]
MKPANLLRIDTLDDEWRDKDMVMLHACFQILCDFIEKEQGENKVIAAPDRQGLVKLYAWWKARNRDEANMSESEYAEDSWHLSQLIKMRPLLWS